MQNEEKVKMIPTQPHLDQVVHMLDNAKDLLDDQKRTSAGPPMPRVSMQTEIRTLEFWRAIIAECIATFFYVVMICSVHQSMDTQQDSLADVQIYTAIATGLAMITLAHAFLPVSGAHLNPAVTIACMIIKKVSILRAALYVCAQCGGAIAGSALVYGIYGAKDQFENVSVSNFGMEFILTFIIVFIYFSANNPHRKSGFDPAVTIGLSYMAVLACYKGALNPARALGPAFVANKFELHWVFWIGPILGGICGAFCFQFIFNVHKQRTVKDIENCSIRSDEDMIDDLERVKQYRTNMMQTYNEGTASLYNTSVKPFKRPMESESVYGGTKSLYNAPIQDNGRRTPGFECSKSVYGGQDEEYNKRQPSRVSLKRSQSTHSKAPLPRRNPYDPLPEAQEKIPPGQGKSFHPRQPSRDIEGTANYPSERPETYSSDPAYSEYIRRKNAAADQCSGSSSGYYSSSKEAEVERRGAELYDSYEKEEKRHPSRVRPARDPSIPRDPDAYNHRRERSIGHRSDYGQGARRGDDMPTRFNQPSVGRTSNITPNSLGSHQSGY